MGVRLRDRLCVGAVVVSGASFLLSAWSWEPSIILGCALAAFGYWRYSGVATWRRWSFYGALALLVLALVSPLDALADDYLFSAHMVQHLILVLLVSSLLVLGLPRSWASWLDARSQRSWPGRLIASPATAWGLSIVALWGWHVPALYDLALRHEVLHVIQHLTFLATGVLFWWQVIDPAAVAGAEPRLAAWSAVLYLFSASAAGSVLGIMLTFMPAVVYSAYALPHDEFGILTPLRERWSLGPLADQQLGGVLMWVVGGSFYLLPIVAVFGRWISAADAELPVSETGQAAAKWSL